MPGSWDFVRDYDSLINVLREVPHMDFVRLSNRIDAFGEHHLGS